MENNINNVIWPKQSMIVRRKVRSPTVSFIQSLFNNIGISSSVAYFVLITVIQPILNTQFLQRTELSASVLLNVRRLAVSLQRRIKTTPLSILGFNEKGGYVERATQTDNNDDNNVFGVSDEYDSNECNPLLNTRDRLKEINDDLDTFNELQKNRSSTNLDQLNLEIKLATDQIMLSDESNEVANKMQDVTASIREIKGWFVSGKIR